MSQLPIDEAVAVLRTFAIAEPLVRLIEEHKDRVEEMLPFELGLIASNLAHTVVTLQGSSDGANQELARDQSADVIATVTRVVATLLGAGASAPSPHPPATRKSWLISWGELQFLTDSAGQKLLLGEGGFGKVFAATYRGMPVAVKQFFRACVESCLDDFKQEASALSNLRHPAIIRFFGATLRRHSEPSEYAIVMERGAMTLLEAINVMRDPDELATCTVPLPRTLDEKLKLLQSLAEALMYLHHHDPPIVLQDIKPANVILTADGKAKFIDFGFATVKATTINTRSGIVREAAASVHIAHTPTHAAPEVLDGPAREPQPWHDVYSFGVLMQEVLTGKPRRQRMTVADTFRVEDAAALGVPVHIVDIIAACTEVDAERRCDSSAIVGAFLGVQRQPEPLGERRASGAQQPRVIESQKQLYPKTAEASTRLVSHNEVNETEASDDDADDFDARTPLHIAAQGGNAALVSLLLDRGADVNVVDTIYNCTPLFLAAQSGESAVVSLLLERGANADAVAKDGLTPLLLAAQNGHADVVDILLCAGALVDAADRKLSTALSAAARSGHVDIATRLLDAGADVDGGRESRISPLHRAAFNGNVEIAALLLSRGANIELFDQYGTSPLHVAAFCGHAPIVALLLDSSANPNITETANRWTPLHMAAQNGHIDAVKLLLNRGADINAVEIQFGCTALHLASQQGHVAVVTALLDHGCEIGMLEHHGWTPVSVALRKGHHEVVKVLLDRGATL